MNETARTNETAGTDVPSRTAKTSRTAETTRTAATTPAPRSAASPVGSGLSEATEPARIRATGRMFSDGTGPAADPAGSHFERRIRSFQPRRSRVSPGQADALRRMWPTWGLEIDGQRVVDPAEMFGGLPVVLEIGFGMGEATARMAAAEPGTGILAVDVHTPGQGNLLRLAEQNGLSNIRVANGDAIILLREMLPPESLDGLRIYFPDPWPKKRHHKRRLIQPEFLEPRRAAAEAGRAAALRDRLGAVRGRDARGAHGPPRLREHRARTAVTPPGRTSGR